MSQLFKCLFQIFPHRTREFQILERADVEEIDEKRLHEFESQGEPMTELDMTLVERRVSPRLGVANLDLVGSGSFSKVYIACGTNKQTFAVKIQSTLRNDYKSLVEYYRLWQNEVRILKLTAGHKNFVQLEQVLYLKHRSALANIPTHVAMKMEFLPLNVEEMIDFDQTSYQGEQQLRNLLLNHLEAIHFLHQRGIVHHDVKGANSMLALAFDKCTLKSMTPEAVQSLLATVDYKVIDLGLAEQLDEPKSSQYRGTLGFMAPEKVDAIRVNTQHGITKVYEPFRAEAYSVGCVAIQAAASIVFSQFLGQRSLKRMMPLGEMFQRAVQMGRLNYIQGSVVLEVILGLVELDPAKRFSIEQAIDLLN